MLAMQYSIQLPPNYGPDQVRARVGQRRGLFDSHSGLVHKSFLFNEADHLYAPFYIWKDISQARDFLLDDLFHGVIEAFARQRVRSWFVLSMRFGDRSIRPQFAQRETDPIAPEARLDQLVAQERRAQAELEAMRGLYLHVLALDADRWELMRFSLWGQAADCPKPHSDCHQQYEVLHVSEPA